MCRYNTIILIIEICGDGINLGHFQCDDGNTESGDGCDSNCNVENGYECYRTDSSQPDICEDNSNPEATISLEEGGILVIRFSKPVRSTLSSKTFVLEELQC